MSELEELTTPCLLLERETLERNAARMRARARELGVALRPHVKTAKCAEVVKLAVGTAPGGITVSTLREAEHFLARGYKDIVYAVGLAPGKLEQVAALTARGARLAVIVDNLDAAGAIASRAGPPGVRIPVLIEIDSDGHRAGVRPDDELLLALGERLTSSAGAKVTGVLTHAGASYECRTVECIRDMAAQERDAAVSAAERLRAAGQAAPVVSVGSTPTCTFATDLRGVTEMRPGTYLFQDLVMAELGVCRIEDIALSVLTTVIGHQPSRGTLLVDAGWMALSADRGTARQAVDQGYGQVCDLDGRPQRDVTVIETNQEHGIVARRDGEPLDPAAFPIGARLRVLPNHACATAAAHDRYFVLEGGKVAAEWERCRGW